MPRREAVLAIAQEIEELNNANLAAQRAEVARRQAAFRSDLHRLLWRSLLLGLVVALTVVIRLRVLERRSDEQRAVGAGRRAADARALAAAGGDAGRRAKEPVARAARSRRPGAHGAADGARARSSASGASGDRRRSRRVAECRQLVDNMFRTVRDLALGLRPSMLDDFGLQPALEWHVRDFTRRYGVHVELDVDGDLDALPDQHRTCVYRVVQEALTNCVRHAQRARSIQVTRHGRARLARRVRDATTASASIRRDAAQGLGLRGIEERVKELHGTMTIQQRAGGAARRWRSGCRCRRPTTEVAACACCWLTITASSAAACAACSRQPGVTVVAEAADGLEAVRLCEEHQPDLADPRHRHAEAERHRGRGARAEARAAAGRDHPQHARRRVVHHPRARRRRARLPAEGRDRRGPDPGGPRRRRRASRSSARRSPRCSSRTTCASCSSAA